MSDLVRLSLSLDRALLDRLQDMIAESGYTNRSEFVRDLLRDQIVQRQWELNEEAIGTITVLYDHHARMLSEKLTDLQHDHHENVMATMHVHLDEHLCVETVLVRGPAEQLRRLANAIRQQRGVLHATLSTSSTGRTLR
jgi:CopG family nickel-responsive transcriptional regulator